MNKCAEIKLYNVLFPLWFLIWIPSYLWLLLIPLNYILDTLVTWYTINDLPDAKQFCLKHSWKICIAGFFSDILGSIILLLVTQLSYELSSETMEKIADGITFNPFNNVASFMICMIALAFSGVLIYLIDRKILYKAHLSLEQATRSAKWLALITAPYLFMIPSGFLYN